MLRVGCSLRVCPPPYGCGSRCIARPGACVVAPAVGAAYLVKWSNIALQAAQMGVIRCVPIYPYICPNWGKIGSLS